MIEGSLVCTDFPLLDFPICVHHNGTAFGVTWLATELAPSSGQGAEQKDAAREKAREDARKKLEDELTKKNAPPKPLPEFGSGEDFPLAQALNRLKGQPVLVSKTLVERKAETETN